MAYANPLRMILAAIFGSIALSLVLASILVVWANRTLTDTNTYVAAVAPLVNDPRIQTFVAAQATDKLIQNVPSPELAAILLTPEQAAGKTPEQLQTASADVVRETVQKILASKQFQQTWKSTNASFHAQLVRQLQDKAGPLTLDLSPLLGSVVSELKATQLAPVADKIQLPAEAGKLSLRGGPIDTVRQYYQLFQKLTVALVAATVVSAGLCVLLSIEHWRTLRRILIGTGVMSLVLALLLQAPAWWKPVGEGAVGQQAAVAVAAVLFHDLQVFLVIFGASSIVLAIATKLYTNVRASRLV